ncbi:hypothetical protein LUW76_06415 [Actinomadura madurae]|uniref:hypothetical protein n=1 Tax=Actinomadura madurae TaxID=1993 RepID=UPI002025E856|nr:hypothetical protein [Actinomadura madurae]URM93990.1 hypothetical protein LUW76_06415 [Actinomadura madurae]
MVAYANLVAEGIPSGWALVRTLPPPSVATDAERVWEASRVRYAAPVAEQPNEEANTGSEDEPPAPSQQTAAPLGTERIGRKRRQR